MNFRKCTCLQKEGKKENNTRFDLQEEIINDKQVSNYKIYFIFLMHRKLIKFLKKKMLAILLGANTISRNKIYDNSIKCRNRCKGY